MSQLAPFVDAAVSIDRTAWNNTFISYYTWGAMLGIAPRPVAAREDRRQGRDGRLHAADVDVVRRAGHEGGARHGGPHLLARRAAGPAGAALWRRRLRPAVLREVRPGPRRARLRARCSPASAWSCANATPAGRGWATPRWPSPMAACGPASCHSTRRSTRPAWPRATRLSRWPASRSPPPQAVQEVLMRYQPGARLALRFVRRSGEAVTIGMNIDEDPRIEIVHGRDDRRHGDPRTAAGPADLAGRESEVRS